MTVTLSCFPNERFSSDASGQVKGKGYGSIDRSCAVHFEKPGFRPVTVKASDVCLASHSVLVGGCREIELSRSMEAGP